MSNEYKDWHRDTSAEAKEWVRKYPFLRFKDNSCCPWENTEEIESCWIFCLGRRLDQQIWQTDV